MLSQTAAETAEAAAATTEATEDELMSFAAEDFEALENNAAVNDALARGLSLQDYTQVVEAELERVEAESVRDYSAQAPRVAELEIHMARCDEMLAQMGVTLAEFAGELRGTSTELRRLQDKTTSSKAQLDNRRAAGQRLSAFLVKIALPSDLEAVLLAEDFEVDDLYCEYLALLRNRLVEYAAEEDGCPPILDLPKGAEFVTRLEDLRENVCARCRDVLLTLIAGIRKAPTDLATARLQVARSCELFDFLVKFSASEAEEVRAAYAETMGKALLALFKTYNGALSRQETRAAGKHDLIAANEEAGVNRSIFSGKVSAKNKPEGLTTLNQRAEVLEAAFSHAPLVASELSSEDSQKYALEFLFRSVVKFLLEIAKSEQRILVHLFGQEADQTMAAVLSKTLAYLFEDLEKRVNVSYDIIGLLLIVRLSRDARRRTRENPVVDGFLEKCCDGLCWPRVLAIVAKNTASVQKASIKIEQQHLENSAVMLPTTPHYAARRYAELTASLLALVKKRDDAEFYSTICDFALLRSTETLRKGVQALLESLAKATSHRLVFLINNYDTMLEIFQERNLDFRHFDEDLARMRNEFVDAELAENFKRLSDFVRRTESAKQRTMSGEKPPSLDPAHVELVAREFKGSWKSVISHLNADILKHFNNFRNGMEILKLCLQKMLRLYSSFLDIVQRSWRRAPPFADQLVQTSAILDEMKQYSRTY